MARELKVPMTTMPWAAGVFEGEGCCHIGSGRQPVVQLTMTDQDVVARFAHVIGRGKVLAYPGVGKRRKPTWRWSVQSKDDVLYVLGLLWPFLGERRRERATEVIERASKMHDSVGYCQHGHDLSLPENVYLHRKTGKRHCVPCRTRRSRERRRVS